jgi:hypothetical protein
VQRYLRMRAPATEPSSSPASWQCGRSTPNSQCEWQTACRTLPPAALVLRRSDVAIPATHHGRTSRYQQLIVEVPEVRQKRVQRHAMSRHSVHTRSWLGQLFSSLPSSFAAYDRSHCLSRCLFCHILTDLPVSAICSCRDEAICLVATFEWIC